MVSKCEFKEAKSPDLLRNIVNIFYFSSFQKHCGLFDITNLIPFQKSQKYNRISVSSLNPHQHGFGRRKELARCLIPRQSLKKKILKELNKWILGSPEVNLFLSSAIVFKWIARREIHAPISNPFTLEESYSVDEQLYESSL